MCIDGFPEDVVNDGYSILSGFAVGYYVDYDAKGEEGSSSFQENAVSTI